MDLISTLVLTEDVKGSFSKKIEEVLNETNDESSTTNDPASDLLQRISMTSHLQ